MNPVEIGKFINEQRKKNNLTQKELANKLLVTSQAISKWENGRGIPDIEMLKKLSEIFDIDIADILEGKRRKRIKNNKIYVIIGAILILIILGISLMLLNKKSETFNFYPIATDNDAFKVKGIIAYDSNKKSIYISEVYYDGADEEEYKALECILYETTGNIEKKISKWGDIENNNEDLKFLSTLLKGIEFNIDDYECGCGDVSCNNLYLRVNALNKDNKTISYNIPLQVDTTCKY